MSDLKDLSQKRYWGGILALGGVVFIWVSSSFAMNVNIYLFRRLVLVIKNYFNYRVYLVKWNTISPSLSLT